VPLIPREPALVRPREARGTPARVPANASPVPSSAGRWGPRSIAAILAVLGVVPVLGFPVSMALATIGAVAVMVVAHAHPVVGALAMTCVAILDAAASDYLNSPLVGNPLGTLTAGLWRYNTIGYALVAVALVRTPSLLRQRNVHVALTLALCASLAAGLLWTPDPMNGLQLLLDFTALFGVIFFFDRIRDDQEAWYWIGVVGGVLGAVGGLAYILAHSALAFTNPNVAVYANVTGMFAACLAFAGASLAPRRQLLLGALAIVNLFWAFLSTSRGGLFVGACCMIFLALEVRSAKRKLLLLGGAVLSAVVIASTLTELQQHALQRLTLLFSSEANLHERTSGRADLVLGAWEIFKAHPFGVGTGGFESTWATLGSVGGQRSFMRSGQRFAAHAGWMRALAENGFIGFGLLLALVTSFGAVALGRRHRSIRHMGVMTTLALAVSFVSVEFHLKGLFFLAGGAIVLLGRPDAPLSAPGPGRQRHQPTLTLQRRRADAQ
jgi:O-antigen ligase